MTRIRLIGDDAALLNSLVQVAHKRLRYVQSVPTFAGPYGELIKKIWRNKVLGSTPDATLYIKNGNITVIQHATDASFAPPVGESWQPSFEMDITPPPHKPQLMGGIIELEFSDYIVAHDFIFSLLGTSIINKSAHTLMSDTVTITRTIVVSDFLAAYTTHHIAHGIIGTSEINAYSIPDMTALTLSINGASYISGSSQGWLESGVVNGHFEDGLDSWGTENCIVEITSGYVGNGLRIISLINPLASGYVTQTINTTPGRDYRLTLRAQPYSVGSAPIYVRIYDAYNNQLKSNWRIISAYPPEGPWGLYGTTGLWDFTATTATSLIKVGALYVTFQSVIFDDIAVFPR